jgi:hypothetical protein
MSFSCKNCGANFPKNQGLVAHLNRKTPCTREVLKNYTCPSCSKSYTRLDSLLRHQRQVCKNNNMAARIDQLEQKIDELTKLAADKPIINTVVNNSNVNTVVNHVTVAPWGTPMVLTDSDVEAALSRYLGPVGEARLPEIVDILMTLVKRGHTPVEARNIHLNPKRADQALALVPGGWAAIPLAEATESLFDGASACIAAQPTILKAPSEKQVRMRTLRAEVPVKYRYDKESAVQLGLRPMEAHLMNTRPGGPGPLLKIDAPAAPPPAAAAAAATAAAAAAAGAAAVAGGGASTMDKLRQVLQEHPARYEVSGALTLSWIVEAAQAAGWTGQELFTALRENSSTSSAEWAGACVFNVEKMRMRERPAPAH